MVEECLLGGGDWLFMWWVTAFPIDAGRGCCPLTRGACAAIEGGVRVARVASFLFDHHLLAVHLAAVCAASELTELLR